MKKKIEFDEKCQSCNGTGLYSGIAENKECAVVCSDCNGTGCFHFIHTYEEFEGVVDYPEIKHVYQTNLGIKVGNGGGYKFSDFGGMSYKDWKSGKQFELGMENRLCTCPVWYYQSVDYDKKPKWCEEYDFYFGSFSKCKQFCNKKECWDRFDNGIQ